jgi:hypothetical protein
MPSSPAGWMLDFGASLLPLGENFAHWQFKQDRMVLVVPKDHPLTKRKRVRLRDLRNIPFIWFLRWVNPVFYDQMMQECSPAA